MQISIITPLFNRLDLTRACLESLRRTLAGWDYEWILIDDGSTDGTREFLSTLPDDDARIRVVFNAAPRGYAANNNHGARIARAPLLCLLNNDTVLLPGWLEPMARLARRLPDVALVGNVQREPVSGLVDHAGIYFNLAGEAKHAARGDPVSPREDYLEWPAVTAACCVVRRRLFLKLRGFDEAFRNGSEDVDFCLRAGKKGYRHFVANRSVIYHYVSASPGRKEGEDENLRIFRERWLPFLQAGRGVHRGLGWQRAEGWRYLRKHRRQPWRYSRWRVSRAVKQILSPLPPSQRLDLLPRLSFRAQDFLRGWRMRKPSAAAPAVQDGAPVFLVVGDTAQTSSRAGVPTVVRSLAGACGRLGAPVVPVMWRPATRSLGLLPLELSVGLDADTLRTALDPSWYEPSAASIYDPEIGSLRERYTDTLSIHDLPPATVPRGAWILLPEVLYQDRTEQILEYARQHGWKLAVILHDTMPTNEPSWFPLGVPREHDAYLRAVSRADLVLPVSGFTAEDWRRFVTAKGLPGPPLKVCVPGADACTRTRAAAGPGRGSSERPLRLLCVSAVVPRKNHRTLIEAFDHVVAARPALNLELTLVGIPQLFNEDNAPEAVRRFVERHPGRVTWTEWVEYSALRKLYEDCDFTVFPSKLEGWPAPVVESLWYGKPCICADTGAMAEAARGGGCLPVDVHHEGVITEAILALAESPERLAALAAEMELRPLKTWEEYAREVLAELAAFDGSQLTAS